MAGVLPGFGVRLIIYDTRIASWNAPGGMVNRYTHRKATEVEHLAQFLCPYRTGELRDSISLEVTGHGTVGTVGVIEATAEHAQWVIFGVPGLIRGKKSGPPSFGRLWVPLVKYGAARGWREEVRGQDANNFLGEALEGIMGHSKFVGGQIFPPRA